MRDEIQLLQDLLQARGPCGEEEEVRALCQQVLSEVHIDHWIDPAGNLIGKIPSGNGHGRAIRVMVHMDELSMIVKRIKDDGSLRVNPLGGIFPFSFGQGAVEILGSFTTLQGVLSFGCMHTTKETTSVNKILPTEHRGQGKSPDWDDVAVITRKSADELKEAGVYPGTRVVIAGSRRKLFHFEDCIAGYFLDNRAAICIALMAFSAIAKGGLAPGYDLYFVATCAEEVGAHGASYAARTLPGDITLAIDVGPVAVEYGTVLSDAPIIVYQDAVGLYDKKLSDKMAQVAEARGIKTQKAIWGSYGSDASLALIRGQSAKAGLLCFPVENTHGYEIMHKKSLHNCADLLMAFLCDRGE